MSNPENKEVETVVEEKETKLEPEVSNKKQPKEKKKDKKPKEHKVARKVKETTSELKKVSWLSFGQICKRTGIVVGFVLLSTLILFGVDRLLSLIYKLIIGG